MEFAPPIWISSDMVYKFSVNDCKGDVIYRQLVTFVDSVPSPALTDKYFQERLQRCLDIFIETYQKWFPTGKRLDKAAVSEKLVHKWFITISPDFKKNTMYYFYWKPTACLFSPQRFEFHWSLFEKRDLSHPASGAGKGPTELIETDLSTLPVAETNNNAINLDMESPSEFRKKVRQARLRVALAELKAAKLAEEYYRRYEDLVDSEDSLSVESED